MNNEFRLDMICMLCSDAKGQGHLHVGPYLW